MSIMKGKLRRSAVVVAFSLGAFQALSVIGASVANAATTCSFAGGVVTVSATGDTDTIKVYQDTNGGIHVAGSTAFAEPAIDGTDDLAGCTGVQFGKATTTTINITGATGVGLLDQDFYVELTVVDATLGTLTTTLGDWGAINWVVNGGNNSAIGDSLLVLNQGNTTAPIDLAGGVNGIDLNNDGDLDLTFANLENYFFGTFSNADGQNIDLSGSTATGAAFPFDADLFNWVHSHGADNTFLGGDGDDLFWNDGDNDTFSPGLGSDQVTCANTDGTVDYSNTATAVNMNLAIDTVTQGTDLDTVLGCVNGVGTAQGDTMIGVDGEDNWFTPGAGNDTVNGGGDGTDEDTYDVSDATTGVTVDLGAGTSTGGSGTDTLSNLEDVNGSPANDAFTGDGNDNALFGNGGNDSLAGGAGDGDGDDSFDGGSGIDTVDYSANTLATTVDLDSGACMGTSLECDFIEPNTVENARLGSGDDVFTGSAFNNIAFPGGGQNSLDGEGGIDTVNYSYGYTAGVTINMTGGGAAGGGQDAIDLFENAVGTAFNDQIFGTDVVAGTNGANLLVGGKGNDQISANAGPDFVRAGAGNDRIRGGAGDDTLKGQGGKDNIRGSGGADDIFGGKGKDFCTGGGGNDFIKTCERPRHHGQGPNGPGLHQRI
jgi:Ca2+-binding RTX toxin-like protein